MDAVLNEELERDIRAFIRERGIVHFCDFVNALEGDGVNPEWGQYVSRHQTSFALYIQSRARKELMKIADRVELAGNTIDAVLDWLTEDGISGNTIDELVDVMQTCLGSAAELREIAGEGC